MLIPLKKLYEKYNLNIKGVLHIGAHAVEELDSYIECGVKNSLWLEANPDQYSKCVNLLDGVNHRVLNYAVYDQDEVPLTFNITNNGESSSLLKLKDHKNHYPTITVSKQIQLKTKRLDTILNNHNISIDSFNFINLDIQGVELRAIKSLGTMLNKIDYIYTEVNRAELYEGCDLIEDIDKYLQEFGFVRVELEWTHADWGDAFYVRGPKFKVIVTSFNNADWVETNIESIQQQTYKNYQVLFVDDASVDNTYNIAEGLVDGDSRFKLIKHKVNMSKAYSFATYIPNFTEDQDVVLFLDGDDWIAYNDVFAKIATVYATFGCWVAYTKLISYPSLQESITHGSEYPESIHKFNLYRKAPFISSHLKTMKAFLFKNINHTDLQYEDEWIRFGDDVALMSAAMEMTPKDKIKALGFVGCVYNNSQTNHNRTSADYNNYRKHEDYIRSIQPYKTIVGINPSKVVSPKMLGRLGNQMFEIAAAYSLALDSGNTLEVYPNDGMFTSQAGEVGSPLNYKDTVFSNVKFTTVLNATDVWKESSFSYTPITYKFENNLRLEGQFQSEKYFIHNRSHILELFKCPYNIKDYLKKRYSQFLGKDSVSLHVRRGDYLLTPNHHPTCGIDYYNKALGLFKNSPYILVMSDDSEWAKQTFTDPRCVIVNGEKDYVDLYLMSMCNHNIIANSSFSWWGAWLNNSKDKKVVAPVDWFGPALSEHDIKDLIPDSWIKL
jgi:FkbM family methyltransferase